MWIIGIIAFIICIAIVVEFSARCPNCKKFSAMEDVDKEIIKTEQISKLEELKIRDKSGNIIGSQEHRIYGEKVTYEITRQCKYCGYTEKRIEYKEIY